MAKSTVNKRSSRSAKTDPERRAQRRCAAVQSGYWWDRWRGVLLSAVLLVLSTSLTARAADIDDTQPFWMLLLGGNVLPSSSASGPGDIPAQTSATNTSEPAPPQAVERSTASVPAPGRAPMSPAAELLGIKPVFSGAGNSSILVHHPGELPTHYSVAPFCSIVLKNIRPLYTAPELPGEGVWRSQGMPTGTDGQPALYRTSYRPSVEYPNAIVHMLVFDMKRLSMKLYIGSGEPGGSGETASIEPQYKSALLAVTNALWKQKHSGEAGAIFRGKVLKPLYPGMATVVVYRDDSVDILEWNEGIPTSLVRDARQLRHLIVRDGKVVDTVQKGGKPSDAEIGLGFLLSEEQTPEQAWWNGFGGYAPAPNYGPDWFIATRSAFGIRKDGNLVFAAGHHISTKDLAKAMVLAGCDRAIHGDANPHNVVANLYYLNDNGIIEKKAKLSPEQRDTLNRYDRSYTSDFFGFFLKKDERDSS
ncbi:MAG TPA: hypothetical protein VK463_11105 [Desulfomonilaceae bacterium]|nr:hypothetical protein [Desulfomonilaceae bacterium]